MIIYVPDTQALIDHMESRELIQIKLPSGGFVNAEPLAFNQIRIVEVISTDPMDYLNIKYQPGNVVDLKVNL